MEEKDSRKDKGVGAVLETKLQSNEIKKSLPKSGLYYFNPKCEHDRCSYDLMTCDACIAYSIELEQNRTRKRTAEIAQLTDKDLKNL